MFIINGYDRKPNPCSPWTSRFNFNSFSVLFMKFFLNIQFTYSQFHNILRLFDVLPDSRFPTRGDYYLKHGIYELPHELPNDLRLKILGN